MSTAQRRTILVVCLVLVVSVTYAFVRAGGSSHGQPSSTTAPHESLPPTPDTDSVPSITSPQTDPQGTQAGVVTADGVVIDPKDTEVVPTTASPTSSSSVPQTTEADPATSTYAVYEIAQHFASEYYTYGEADTPALWQERVGTLTTDRLRQTLQIEAYDEGISTVGTTFPTEEVIGSLGDDYAEFTVYVEQTQYDAGVKGPSLTLPMTVVLVKQGDRWLVTDFHPPS